MLTAEMWDLNYTYGIFLKVVSSNLDSNKLFCLYFTITPKTYEFIKAFKALFQDLLNQQTIFDSILFS
jgi:hypothetical protein